MPYGEYVQCDFCDHIEFHKRSWSYPTQGHGEVTKGWEHIKGYGWMCPACQLRVLGPKAKEAEA